LTPEKSVDCEVLADTGATLTLLPPDVVQRLGLQAQKDVEFSLADGRSLRRPVGVALIGINGDAVPARVIFGQPGGASLLGLTVLEQLGLAVDPVARRLVPAKLLLY
jgi:clan AA aspartic protease